MQIVGGTLLVKLFYFRAHVTVDLKNKKCDRKRILDYSE